LSTAQTAAPSTDNKSFLRGKAVLVKGGPDHVTVVVFIVLALRSKAPKISDRILQSLPTIIVVLLSVVVARAHNVKKPICTQTSRARYYTMGYNIIQYRYTDFLLKHYYFNILSTVFPSQPCAPLLPTAVVSSTSRRSIFSRPQNT